jgi:predicted glycoside hydrolase/deacetylase ChbG (UPF0249 family)
MVFMEDSERAASLAVKSKLEVGLHLNFTLPFNAYNVFLALRKKQNMIVSNLGKHKLLQVIYNPFLADSFNFLFLAQQEEYIRLYGRVPDFINGHHHMHLCCNMLASCAIPKGKKIRGTFTFDRGEKNPVNLFYRRMVKRYISKRFVSTDSFFSIAPVQNRDRVRQIFNRAVTEIVELEVHPENENEMEFLMSDEFGEMLDSCEMGRFRDL